MKKRQTIIGLPIENGSYWKPPVDGARAVLWLNEDENDWTHVGWLMPSLDKTNPTPANLK